MSEQAIAGSGAGPAVEEKGGRKLAAGDAWGGVAATLVAFPSAIAIGVVLGIVAPLVGRDAGPVELFALRRSDFDALVEQHGRIGSLLLEHLAKTIAARLRLADVELRTLEER